MSLVDYGFYSDEEEEKHDEEAGRMKYACEVKVGGTTDANTCGNQNAASVVREELNEMCSSAADNSQFRPQVSSNPGFPSIISTESDLDNKTLVVTPSKLKTFEGCIKGSQKVSSTEQNEAKATSQYYLGSDSPVSDKSVIRKNKQVLERMDALMPHLCEVEVPKELLETVERLHQLKKRGITVNGNINTSLDFKNPYLLEKIMKVFDIDPYCSNYPKNRFDLSCVIPYKLGDGKAAFYTHLAKRQEARRQRREKQRDAKESVHHTSAPFTSHIPACSGSVSPRNPVISGALDINSDSHATRKIRKTRFESPPNNVYQGMSASQSFTIGTNQPVHLNVAVQLAAQEAAKKVGSRTVHNSGVQT